MYPCAQPVVSDPALLTGAQSKAAAAAQRTARARVRTSQASRLDRSIRRSAGLAFWALTPPIMNERPVVTTDGSRRLSSASFCSTVKSVPSSPSAPLLPKDGSARSSNCALLRKLMSPATLSSALRSSDVSAACVLMSRLPSTLTRSGKLMLSMVALMGNCQQTRQRVGQSRAHHPDRVGRGRYTAQLTSTLPLMRTRPPRSTAVSAAVAATTRLASSSPPVGTQLSSPVSLKRLSVVHVVGESGQVHAARQRPMLSQLLSTTSRAQRGPTEQPPAIAFQDVQRFQQIYLALRYSPSARRGTRRPPARSLRPPRGRARPAAAPSPGAVRDYSFSGSA